MLWEAAGRAPSPCSTRLGWARRWAAGVPLATSGWWVGGSDEFEFGLESRRHGHRTGATACLHSQGVCRWAWADRCWAAFVGCVWGVAGKEAARQAACLRLSGGAPRCVSAAASVWRSVLQTARMCGEAAAS